MRRRIRQVVWFGLGVLLLAQAAGATDLRGAYSRAISARAGGDFEGYRTWIEKALAIDPSHPLLHQHMARALAGLDRLDESVHWVGTALDLGADYPIGEDPYLEPLHQQEQWPELLQRQKQNRAFVGVEDVRLNLGRGDLLTESFAYDSRDGSFYFGSVSGRNILRWNDEGEVSEFVETEGAGLPPVLGVKIETQRDWLWALGNADSTLFGYSPGLRTGVWAFHVKDGSLAAKWEVPDDGRPHNLNDLAFDDQGNVYITDAAAGALFVIRPLVGRLQTLVDPGKLSGPNGIAFDPTRGILFVSEYGRGVRALDLEAGSNWLIATPDDWTLIGIDGLYCHGGDLVTIQNAMGMSRVARVELSADGRRVTGARTLQANHPRASDPTTGVVVGDELWYIVNSHIATYAQEPERLETFDPTLVLRVALEP